METARPLTPEIIALVNKISLEMQEDPEKIKKENELMARMLKTTSKLAEINDGH